MSEEITRTFNEMKNLFSESNHKYDEMHEEVKKIGEATGETKAALDKMNDDLVKRVEELEKIASRPPSGEGREEKSAEMQAFVEALKVKPRNYDYLPASVKENIKTVTVDEMKALNLADDALGGYFAPTEFVNELIRELVEISPIRRFCRTRTTSNRAVAFPLRPVGAARPAVWTRELALKDDTGNFKLGMDEIPVHEMYLENLVTEQDLEDSAYDLEGEIRRDFADQAALLEASAFLTGDGNGKPHGILSHTLVNTAISGTDTYGGSKVATVVDKPPEYLEIAKAIYDLPDPYASGARVFMHRRSIGYMRGLEDTAGNYIFALAGNQAEVLASGSAMSLMGLPVSTLVGMDSLVAGDTAATTDDVPLIIGDLNRAYYIVDRLQMVVKRLVELYARTGQVAIIGRRRVGGQVVLPEAIRIVKIG